MARYERGKREFWEIALEGTRLLIASGAIGTPGKRSTRTFKTPGQAAVQYKQLIAAHEQDGFARVETPTVAGDDPAATDETALERAITANPYDRGAWLVYADWLQRTGDPRGELAALQIAAEDRPDDRALRAKARKYLERHASTLLGPLAHLPIDHLRWRAGFIHRLLIGGDLATSPADLVDDVLRHPSGRFLAEVELRWHDSGDIRRALELLGKRAPPALQSLMIVSQQHVGDLGVLASLTRLRRLCVKAHWDGDPGEALSPECVASIARGPWPLVNLELRFGGGAEWEDLEPLFARTDLPDLAQLRFRQAPFANRLLRTLIDSPLANQLTVLEVSLAQLNAATTQLLLDQLARFPRLKELVVTREAMSPRHFQQLGQRLKRVRDRTRDPDDRDDDADD